MLDNDQSKGGFSVLYILFFFVALVFVGGFLDQSHAGTGTFKADSQAQRTDGIENVNVELAEISQGNEMPAQTYAE